MGWTGCKKPAIIAGGVLLGTLVYALHVQFNPKMGNVWLRRDDNNVVRFRPKNLLDMMCAPFYKDYFWGASMLDLNYVVYAAVGAAVAAGVSV